MVVTSSEDSDGTKMYRKQDNIFDFRNYRSTFVMQYLTKYGKNAVMPVIQGQKGITNNDAAMMASGGLRHVLGCPEERTNNQTYRPALANAHRT